MSEALGFDHIHIVSDAPEEAARWYEKMFGAKIVGEQTLREAPQINVQVAGITVLIRGRRPGEDPSTIAPMQDFGDYSSHNHWGTDHFGFIYRGDLKAYCEELRGRGAEFTVEPWEFSPGGLICYVAAPDGVSIEIVQGRAA